MISIPKRFEKKLLSAEDNPFELSAVIKNFSHIYIENNTYFFNEYTDHGIRHINSVLSAMDKLITSSTWKLLSKDDIIVLIVGTFLHDLGMHLQPLTFISLINDEYDDVSSLDFGDKPWSLLWNEYLNEVKKWTTEDIHNIYGNHIHAIEMPDLKEISTLNANTKKLIGEFIRRHHPRMAYEIAFKGLKANDGTFIDICFGMSLDLRFLSAVVARSHGMHVRETFKTLKKRYSDSWKLPYGTHTCYLMLLLRLADYFQIDKERILKVPFKTKLFQSPISIFEHQKHFNIIKCQALIDDSETLFFNTRPDNSTLFVSIKELFTAIQQEIDTCWAILGEIYGNTKMKPALRYRRIRSNLDDASYVDTLPFVPEKISFSADKELLKLLIAPLYGRNPTYGIRELLQNSVDACWERKALENNNNYSGKINIDFEVNDQDSTLSISDNGKGMTASEIKNYFLRAGSSLKKSKEWKQKFTGEDRVASVHRIGKFGIGVLAAYLLGNLIKVETKAYNSDFGYSFSASINDDSVEVLRVDSLPIGTKITITIPNELALELFKIIRHRIEGNSTIERYQKHIYRWDKWYTLNDPELCISVNNQILFPSYEKYNPSFFEPLPIDWREFQTEDFAKVLWTFSTHYAQAELSCNGIVIPAGYQLSSYDRTLLRKPQVSIFDFKGYLNLELDRDSIVNNKLPFEEKLIEAVYCDIISQIFSYQIKYETGKLMFDIYNTTEFTHPGLAQTFRFFFNEEGYNLNMPFFIKSIGNKKVLSIAFKNGIKPGTEIIINLGEILVTIESPTGFPTLKSDEIEYINYMKKCILKYNIGLSSAITWRSYSIGVTRFDTGFTAFCEKHFGNMDMTIPYDPIKKIEKFGHILQEIGIKM